MTPAQQASTWIHKSGAAFVERGGVAQPLMAGGVAFGAQAEFLDIEQLDDREGVVHHGW
jgi:hypothetical protein